MQLWEFISKRYGVKIVTVKCDNDDFVHPAEIERIVDSKTRLISLYHARFDSGTLVAAKEREIGKIAKEKGVLYLLDGAQSAGVVDIKVRELGCHFYAFGGQKSLFAGQGVGALYMAKDKSEEVTPLIISTP